MSWWAVLACWLLTSCRTARELPTTEPVRRSQPLLGTFVTISAYGSDRLQVARAISQAFEEFHRVDRLMSIHRRDSELSQVNERAAISDVTVSPELFRVLETALGIAHQTGGAFDVTIRPLADLWGFIWKEYRLPTETELASVRPLVGYRLVELNAEKCSVRFVKPGVSLDFGGIGKGVAVDLAIERLKALGVTNAMVKAGGDLRVMGAPPGRAHWEVQLEDPAKRGQRVTIPLRDSALSTSGNYENYFEVDGRRYSHILDPRTGLPVSGIASCTVIAPTCTESDAWATALFVLGVDESFNRFGDRFPIRFVLTPERGKDWRIKQNASFPDILDGRSATVPKATRSGVR